MSRPIDRARAKAWRSSLAARLAPPARPLPDGHMLDRRADWMRRITGGTLIDFFRFAEESAPRLYDALRRAPLSERVFVFVTDEPGEVAFRELVDASSPIAICVRQEAWRAFLEEPGADHDDGLERHYEAWSVWHQRIEGRWEFEIAPHEQAWVHEEGFALADGIGRGSRSIWAWDGLRMRLAVQDIEKWVGDL